MVYKKTHCGAKISPARILILVILLTNPVTLDPSKLQNTSMIGPFPTGQ